MSLSSYTPISSPRASLYRPHPCNKVYHHQPDIIHTYLLPTPPPQQQSTPSTWHHTHPPPPHGPTPAAKYTINLTSYTPTSSPRPHPSSKVHHQPDIIHTYLLPTAPPQQQSTPSTWHHTHLPPPHGPTPAAKYTINLTSYTPTSSPRPHPSNKVHHQPDIIHTYLLPTAPPQQQSTPSTWHHTHPPPPHGPTPAAKYTFNLTSYIHLSPPPPTKCTINMTYTPTSSP